MMMENYNPNGMQPIYGVSEEVISSSLEPNQSQPSSFIYNLSVLKDRVHQVEGLATILLAPNHSQQPESTAIAIPTMGTLIQEIIVTASSMMYACQQMALGSSSMLANNNNNGNVELQHDRANKTTLSSGPSSAAGGDRAFYTNHHETLEQAWYGENYNTSNNMQSSTSIAISTSNEDCRKELPPKMEMNEFSPNSYDIVELEAADLLAKYTHYCHVCGKGFKRDANLRMHMRAHGDEYKSSAALSNPMKNNQPTSESSKSTTKYSCPQEGCRWNKNHAKFQPLKSMICVKNHYKRSHCPKMYVCKRCNTKNFSVLSDLRTHEKHCGDLKWQCSCGTTFSRKDKLMGHVALFVGHTPASISLSKMGSGAQVSSIL